MPILNCHEVVFYSQLDESMFFEALENIAAVKRIEGRGADLFLSVPSQLSNKSLRELLGLFFRYGVEMQQLAPFLTEKNRAWFHSPQKYWFGQVFPSTQ